MGRDEYPISVASTFDLLNRHSGELDKYRRNNRSSQGRTGSMFAQRAVNSVSSSNVDETASPGSNDPVPGTDGRLLPNIKCYNCQAKGHYAGQCPFQDARQGMNGSSFIQYGFCHTQSCKDVAESSSNVIDKNWLLLDTCSTHNVCANVDLIDGLRSCDDEETLHIVTNGGSLSYSVIGNCKLLPVQMHYNQDSIANVLSLKSVASIPGVRVTMDSGVERAIMVELPEKGRVIKFVECTDGLYYHDTKNSSNVVNPYPNFVDSNDVHVNLFMNTITNNKLGYNKKQIDRAIKARQLHQELGWPSTQDLKKYIKTNYLKNCKVTVDDVDRAELIYGKPTPILQGKMTRTTQSAKNIIRNDLPHNITKEQRHVNMFIDIMFVNKIPFLLCKSDGIVNHCQAHFLSSRGKANIFKKLNLVRRMYEKRGFQIDVVRADNEFDFNEVKSSFPNSTWEICAKGEHVPIIERAIRSVKDRCRPMCHSIPFTRYTKLMTVHLVLSAIKWINSFPAKNMDNAILSPSNILEGKGDIDLNIKRIPFGSYVLVYVGTKNNMQARSVPAIALSESNESGGNFFMSILTGKRLHSNKWERLPFDDDVIDKVEQLATHES